MCFFGLCASRNDHHGAIVLKTVFRCINATIIIASLAVGGYTVSPLATAYALNCAIKSGDSATMNSLVDWGSVKDSLRASILQRLDEKALVRPDHPGWYQSVKFSIADAVSPYMVDHVLSQRVTPEGFTTYMGPHSPKAEAARAAGLDPDTMPSAAVATRIHHAYFTDLTHFEIEIVDRWDAGKVFCATLELHGLMWQLANVRMLSLGEGA